MKYLVRIEWSQTDHENVLVNASNAREAEKKAMQGTNALFCSGTWLVTRDKTK